MSCRAESETEHCEQADEHDEQKQQPDEHSSPQTTDDLVKEQLEKGVMPVDELDEHEHLDSSLKNKKVLGPGLHDEQETNNMDNYLLQTLDELERRTEKLRVTVREVETERLDLLQSLNNLMQSQALVSAGERDELELYMDRLTNRLLTINVSVQIVRSPPQEESLQLVQTLLRKLQNNMRQGETESGRIYRYLNSCMELANGPVDDTFQGALLGCAVEDQKEIRKMLTSLWEAKGDTDRQMAVLASMSLD